MRLTPGVLIPAIESRAQSGFSLSCNQVLYPQ